MGAPENFHSFVAHAKICSSKLAIKYVKGANVGKDMSELMDKLILLRSFICSFENYQFPCCSEFLHKGIKSSKSGKVILSSKNFLFLKSQEEKIKLDSDHLNCISIKELCLMAEQIRSICINC